MHSWVLWFLVADKECIMLGAPFWNVWYAPKLNIWIFPLQDECTWPNGHCLLCGISIETGLQSTTDVTAIRARARLFLLFVDFIFRLGPHSLRSHILTPGGKTWSYPFDFPLITGWIKHATMYEVIIHVFFLQPWRSSQTWSARSLRSLSHSTPSPLDYRTGVLMFVTAVKTAASVCVFFCVIFRNLLLMTSL